jgi:RNA polymerase sigma factor (TIGR02999 family)
MRDDPRITSLLQEWSEGDRDALGRLLPEVLDELRVLARHHLAGEQAGHTLQPTALINELYLRLSASRIRGFEDRHRFFAFASRLLRQILVDHGRARRSRKRGGEVERVPLELALEQAAGGEIDIETVLVVDQALDRLGQMDARQARVVELRYFGGMSLPEIAQTLGLSQSSVERSWRAAKHWLAHRMAKSSATASLDRKSY